MLGTRVRRYLPLAVGLSLFLGLVPAGSPPAALAAGPGAVISEFRVRGPNGGSDEFVEIFNSSHAAIAIGGWKLRGSNVSGTIGDRATVPAGTSLGSGCYFLFTNSSTSGGPYSGSVPGNVTYGTGIGDDGGLALTRADNTIVDMVGMSTGSAFKEGTPLANLGTSNQNRSYERKPGGALGGTQDTDANSSDFQLITPSTPQNASSTCVTILAPTNPTGEGAATPSSVAAGGQSLLTVAVTAGANPTSSGLAVSADLTTIGGSATQAFFDDGSNGDATSGDNVFSYGATVTSATSAGNKTLPFTVTDAQARSSGGSIALRVVEPCGAPFTPIFALQGSGGSTPHSGASHHTEGVVIGNYQGGASTLRGFYVQDATGDGDATTSDGIFVFNGGSTQTLAIGDHVRVSGTVAEFQGQTQISMSSVLVCDDGHNVAATDVTFPVPAAVGGVDYLERVEGMLVRLPQTMYVTEHFQLGRFGQVLMSSGDRLRQPTSVVAPGAPAAAMQAANNLNKILVDDDLQSQNPDPIVFGRGGQPLSASNTLRGGDTATNITGVMTWTWAGNAASGNAWRIRPNTAMHGGVPDFQPTNPRPTNPPAVGGTVKLAAVNLLNYFNTFSGCTAGAGGPSTGCRGASNAAEFNRQWPKTVAALVGLDAAVIGVNEVENDGYGPGSALADLVGKLNAATSPGKFAYIDVDANTGQTNAMGTDAIKVGMLYQPALVTPVGQTSALNSVAFVNGGDGAPRSRPSLAQAFMDNASGSVFIVDINHLKSKGSACDLPDQGDGQGNCNAVRTNAANELASWLATDPTGTGSPDVIVMGDLNSYAEEDPIVALENAGYTNLVAEFAGPDAYSYVFDGQWGYLDHALGSASMTARVTGVADWHINADEPPILDYNTDFKSAGQQASLYAPDQFRMSDHDALLVGLDFSPSGTKQAVIEVLRGLLPTGDAKTDRRIEKAVARLEKSLTPEWWIDDDSLSLSDGQKVFAEEKKVVRELGKKQLEDNFVARYLIQLILDADRALAAAEIAAAEDAGGRPKDIAKAWSELADGDAERADGRWEHAVERYKHAWEKARNAQR